MFTILFGWRKASKCKKLIKRVQCRLKLLKNKRICIMKQLKKDVAELLKQGHDLTAFQRVEQVVIDDNMMQVYDLLYQFCEFVVINLPYISTHRDCPDDIKEAVSALIFSSSRFGELPELLSIRKLFAGRYGKKFVASSLDGNLVTNQIVEKLDVKRVPDDVKYRFLDEISPSFLQKEQLFLEYKHDLQEKENPKGRKVGKRKDEGYKDKRCWREYEIETCSDVESSGKLGEEVMYLDDIEELISPVIQDQRLFKFSVAATHSESRRKRSLIQETLDEKDDAIGRLSLSWNINARESEATENIIKSSKSSSTFSHLYEDYSPCRHIHPKLPDYDELAAKFMELKRANLLNNSSSYISNLL